jgi:undecaprenyl-diphosphatase
VVVASTFILGGFIILWAEARYKRERQAIENSTMTFMSGMPPPEAQGPRIVAVEQMSSMDALKVGLIQCLAMIPGTSRSGATIIGGMFLGLSRKAATDFSFYLAIPTLIGAGVYSLYKERALLSMADLPMFAVGLIVSFISAWFCVKWLLKFISTHTFNGFAYYRIGFGLIVLATAWSGMVKWAPT